jgi:Pyruvate/2-oxoacid:ferredoxin oxidoreductase delta subunit
MAFCGFGALGPLIAGAYSPGGIFVFSMVSIGIVLYVISFLQAIDYLPGKKTDVILCSYSGNTAEYAGHFISGMKKSGAEINVHRFHYHKRFDAKLTGDSLVIAFPVIGWKPPWPLVSYIIKKLPRGYGKPAFVLYTSAGGPENAGIVAWFLLTLKGYRVVGRLWSIYPMNIPTIRLGPKAVWQFIDKKTPVSGETETAEKTGIEFALGKITGLPFVLWPFVLVIFGALLDNPALNTILYRNYAWRRRCIKCGLCVNYCPSERLSMVNGYPKAKGACIICFGCVNICPENAMHLVCWTEYGFQYKPRWPDGVVKKRE